MTNNKNYLLVSVLWFLTKNTNAVEAENQLHKKAINNQI